MTPVSRLLCSRVDVGQMLGYDAVRKRVRGADSVVLGRLPDCWLWLSPGMCLDYVAPVEDLRAESHRAVVRQLIQRTVRVMVTKQAEGVGHPSKWLTADYARLIVGVDAEQSALPRAFGVRH